MAEDESNTFLIPDEVTTSLLQEYSIAENPDIDGSLIQLGDLPNMQDAFSRYAKVIFHDIADSYPTDADVQCFFSLTIDMKHKVGDIVGLFRLGWDSPSDMVTSQIVPNPSNPDQRDFQVTFRASELPKEEGEIYQLCYISQNEVYGASVPFEFRRVTAEELLVVDSGDIVIVRSQSAVVEDLKSQLASVRKELISAEANNVEMQKKLTEVQAAKELAEKRVSDLREAEKAAQRTQRDCEHLNNVIAALHTDIKFLQNEVNSQAEEIAKYQSMAQNASQRGCSQDLIDALREGKELAVKEMRTAMADNEKVQLDLAKAAEEKDNLRQKLDELTGKYNTVLETQETNESALEKRTEDLLVKLTQLTSESHKRISDAKTETQLLQMRITALETELEKKNQNVQVLNRQEEFSLVTMPEDCLLPEDSPLPEDSSLPEQKPLPEDISTNSNNSMSMESPEQKKFKKEAVDAEIQIIEKRLADVQIRIEEVREEIQILQTDMEVLQQTEESLVQSHTRLTNRMKCLQNIIADAEGCGNTMEASLHQRELKICEVKLLEKNICLESARQRRDELERQLKELEQENMVLEQQESETVATLEIKHQDTSLRCGVVKQEVNTGEAGTSSCHTEAARPYDVEATMSELLERLRQAAEAYKTLYQEKRHTEKQLVRLQEKERHRQEGPEQ